VRSSKTKLHTEQAQVASNTMTHRIRWRLGALASAVALLGSLTSIEAHALALGRVTVQSALGEALRAEIDIAEINADEASSLRVGIASSEAFKAAGLEYSAAVVGLQISLQKRPDGRSFLRLSSPKPVTEPFVDLVVEANWSSGRVVRDYTMLFDPPNLRQATGPSAAPSLGGSSTPVQPQSRRASPSAAVESQSVRPVPMAKPARQRAEPAQKPQGNGQQVTVKSGDTASKIAGQNKPAGISLDQMLVALLKSNPDAFIGGNINRLKSGAVIDLPSEETAGATSAGQASQTIIAQSKDFNNFRRKLADGAPAAQVAGADRKADGKLQAKVEDNVSGAKPPDKLTFS
jgi:pilus assembly protein FimV